MCIPYLTSRHEIKKKLIRLLFSVLTLLVGFRKDIRPVHKKSGSNDNLTEVKFLKNWKSGKSEVTTEKLDRKKQK